MINQIIKKVCMALGVYPSVKKLYSKVKFRNSKDYWEQRYKRNGTSGAGSYGILAEYKAEIINDFCRTNDIETVCEWGCGDGNQLRYMNYKEYLGLDVSAKAIELCRQKFDGDKTKEFAVISGTFKPEKKYDMSLSLDVIYHLVEDAVFERYMKNLFSSSGRYVCIYASDFDAEGAAHVRHRHFTPYIERIFPEFALIRHIRNKYPFDEQRSGTSSPSDFFFYIKKI